MLIFILIYFIYFIGKYIDFRQRMTKIFEFIRFYNKVNGAHSDILLSFNIIKSYLYDEKIPILNKTNGAASGAVASQIATIGPSPFKLTISPVAIYFLFG